MCVSPGLTKNTYGTGCFLLQNIGDAARWRRRTSWSDDGRVEDRGRTEYALEGSVFIGGAVVQWLRDGLGIIRTLGRRRNAGGVGAGQRRRVSRAGVRRARRAALGSVCARHRSWASRAARPRHTSPARRSRASPTRSPICWMRCGRDAGIPLSELRVDGGAATNDLLMQFQADLLGVPVVRPAVTETTALGAAYLAGLAVGFWRPQRKSHGQWQVERRFEPAMARSDAERLRGRWREAVDRAKGWVPRHGRMTRDDMLSRLARHRGPWDFLVIGGGATGVGVAVDAASRGYSVLLLEQSDFGKGTSSRSTKLVHGGVRYLEQGNISLVMEALKERGLLRQNAPHLVSRPALRRPQLRLVGGAVLRHRPEGLRPARRQVRVRAFGDPVLRRNTRAPARPSRREGLRGGVVYYDGQFDDTRLLINLVQTAAEQGAVLLNYVKVIGVEKGPDGYVDGVVARDMETRPRVHGRRADRHQCDRPLRRRRPAHGGSRRAAADCPEPGCPPRVRPIVSSGRERHHGSAHPRRPRDVRDSLARSHGRGHDRHADRRAVARATRIRHGDRVHSRDRGAVPPQGADARRRAERVHRDPSAGSKRRQPDHRGALARSHHPHRSIGDADDQRAGSGRRIGTWRRTRWITPWSLPGCPSVPA